MTKQLGVQVKVFDRQSLIGQFKMSGYYDCRINAYSSLHQQDESISFYASEPKLPITIFVIDLDLKDFNNSTEELDASLRQTLKKIRETIVGCPTVLDTGNGYHFYQPVHSIIPDNIDGLKEYADFHDKYYLPNKFLEWNNWLLNVPCPINILNLDNRPQPYEKTSVGDKKNNFIVDFAAVKNSCPRLRFGKKYTMRCRITDLAGNTVHPVRNLYLILLLILELSQFRHLKSSTAIKMKPTYQE